MTRHKQPRAGSEGPDLEFEPIIVRNRHDGWSAEKQIAFVQALASAHFPLSPPARPVA